MNQQLFEHQKTGIEFPKKAKKAILADSMGLGKTRQAIIAAKELSGGGVVVCPASLKINWQREINKVYPDDHVFIVQGGKVDFVVDFMFNQWFVINYDVLSKHKWLIDAIRWHKTLILDEAHYIKGRSIRAKKAIELSMVAENVYCLTGTPVMNRPIELFNLLQAVGHYLGKNRTAYAKRYCGAFMMAFVHTPNGKRFMSPLSAAYGYASKPGYRLGQRFLNEGGATHLDELRKNIDLIFLRRKKEDVLDLPERIVSVQEVKIEADQKKQYDNAWDNYLEFFKENPVSEEKMDNILMARHLVEIQKLKQICSIAKVPRMADDIENAIEQEEKVIVFSQYTDTINHLAAEMMGRGISYETLTGQDDMDQRQAAIDKFQKDPETKVFISNIKAGGVGITLTAASIVMFADMDWSPEIHNQAIDRAHRIGQNKMVNAYFYYCPETVEDDIMELLNAKKDILDQVVEGQPGRIKTESIQQEFMKRMAQKSNRY